MILRSLYNQIIHSFPVVPPEAGGIIGSRNDVVCFFQYDVGLPIYDHAEYTPNLSFLNQTILQWSKQNIHFSGLVHSHPFGQEELSNSDIEYIHAIMESMPQGFQSLFFPIVIPHIKIIPFKAALENNHISIHRDTLEIE